MGATISNDGTYRYQLWRVWNNKLPMLYWVMLNPSTANAETDDPTIRKCVGFAGRGGFGGIYVMNLFAFRATDPKQLIHYPAARVGPQNDQYLRLIAGVDDDDRVIVAWGAQGALYPSRVQEVKFMLPYKQVRCLGLTKDGHPKHPLYVKYGTPLQAYPI